MDQRSLKGYSPLDGRVRHDWSNLAYTCAYVEECDCWPYGKERKVKSFSCVQLCDPITVACQAPLSMGFSGQEYWSGLPCPSPGDLPNPGIEPASPALAGGFFTTSTTWESHSSTYTREKWNENISLQKELCMNSHSSTTNNSQNIETIQTPINLWMDEQNAAYPHSGILFNHIKN